VKVTEAMQITLHGHIGHDLDQEVDVTDCTSAFSCGHSTLPPWETINLTMELPAQLWQKVLAGVPVPGGRVPRPGFWVVIWINPLNKPEAKINRASRVAMAWGYVDTVDTGFTHHDKGVLSTQPLRVSCISWLSMINRSNMVLADGQSTAGREGFVYNIQDWQKSLNEVLKLATEQQPGQVLARIFNSLVRVRFPTTLTGKAGTRDFGQDIQVIYDEASATKYAPTRAAAMFPVQGQNVHSAAQILPTRTMGGWLQALFVPDEQLVEWFPSLEYPKHGTVANFAELTTPPAPATFVDAAALLGHFFDFPPPPTTPGTPYASVCLGGAMPVMVYRHKPFCLRPITATSAQESDKKDGYPTDIVYPLTASEQANLHRQPVDPTNHGYADPYYNLLPDEILAVEGVQWSDNKRANLAIVNTIFGDGGPVKAYDLISSPVTQDVSDFNRYGQRAANVSWPFLPPVDGQPVPTNQSSGNQQIALNALNELAWSIVGGQEKTFTCRVKARFLPQMRAGHWFQGYLNWQLGQADSLMGYVTGYIDQVTHSARIVNPETGHFEADTVIHLSRAIFSSEKNKFYWTVASKDTRVARKADAEREEANTTAPDSVPAKPGPSLKTAKALLNATASYNLNVPTQSIVPGNKFVTTPGTTTTQPLNTPEERQAAFERYRDRVDQEKRATRTPIGPKVRSPKFSALPSSVMNKDQQLAQYPTVLTIFDVSSQVTFLPNSIRQRDNAIIRYLVIHITDSDREDGTVYALNRAIKQKDGSIVFKTASTHFQVDKDGTVAKLLDPDAWIAHHASGHNTNSIGIDFVGSGKVTPAQQIAGQLLIDFLIRRYGLSRKVYSKNFRATAKPGPVTVNAAGKKVKGPPIWVIPPPDAGRIIADNYGVLRHYNVASTLCPLTTPVEAMTAEVTWQYEVVVKG